MGFGFREAALRLEAIDESLRRRYNSLNYPEWFMMPTNEGVRFLLATALLGLASLNTGNNLIYLIFGLMLSIILLAYLLAFTNIRGLKMDVSATGPVYAATQGVMVLNVYNHKKMWSSYSLRIKMPHAYGAEAYVPHIPAGQMVQSNVSVRFVSRGVYGAGMFTVQSGFPFIFFQMRRNIPVQGEMIVYPEVTEVDLDAHALGGEGGKLSLRPGQGDDLLALRNFREGDDRKTVHWKASARAGRLLVKEYAETEPRTATLVLDNTGAGSAEAFEKAVSFTASCALWLINSGYYVRMLSCDHDVPFGYGIEHLYKLMDYLAVVTSAPRGECPEVSGISSGISIFVMLSASSPVLGSVDERSMVVHADTL